MPLYSDFPLVVDAQATPLVLFGAQVADNAIIVHPDVIREYQQMIFQLEAEVLRYRRLLEQYNSSPVECNEEEDAVEASGPLNAASVRVLNSIFYARINDAEVRRASDDDEEEI